jgi:hypothetical protein
LGVPCGSWGVSCGTWGVSPGTWAKSFKKLGISLSLLLSSPDSGALSSFFLERKEIKLGAHKRFREEGDTHCKERRATKWKLCKCKDIITLQRIICKDSATDTKNLFPFPCAMELSSEESCPTRRGWTFCPAQARPFWIKEGRARCTTSRRLGSEEKNFQKTKEACVQVRLHSATDTLRGDIHIASATDT